MPIVGQKNLRGQAELHSEVKVPVSVGLSLSAVRQLDLISTAVGCSRSELVERIARGLVQILWCESGSNCNSQGATNPNKDVIRIYYTSLLHDKKAQPLKVLLLKDSSEEERESSA